MGSKVSLTVVPFISALFTSKLHVVLYLPTMYTVFNSLRKNDYCTVSPFALLHYSYCMRSLYIEAHDHVGPTAADSDFYWDS